MAAIPRILLVSSGLDHARRGFESFARECFDSLRTDPGVDIALVKGSGPSGTAERSLPTFRRDRFLARAVGSIIDARPFRIEAFSFGFSLFPLIARRKPDVIYLSEWDTARVLAKLRSLTGLRFKLLLSNGSFASERFEHLDCVQELTPAALEHVLAHGADADRHTLLPLGFKIDRELRLISKSARTALRKRLDLPADRPIIVSVAALNRYHKRLDYLIEEIASLPDPRPFLLLVGQPEEETPALRALAHDRLGAMNHTIRTVPAAEVPDLCRASDAFVLASVYEGLPRALIEASALGLPCLVHSYAVSEYALGPHAYSADLSKRGSLAGLISRLTDTDHGAQKAAARHAYAYEHFSWDMLRPHYVELLRDLAATEAGPRRWDQVAFRGKLWHE